MSFTFSQTVLFQHCDPAGIVFYPRYFEMLNATVETWFARRLGHSFALLHGAMGSSVPTAQIQVTFVAPSRLGEDLDLALQLVRLGRSSADLRVDVTCAGAMRLRIASTLVHVAAATLRPAPWPEALRRMMEADCTPEMAPQASAG